MEGDNQVDCELLEIKKELRKKQKLLKKFSRALDAKQHVRETLKRCNAMVRSQEEEASKETTSSSKSTPGSSGKSRLVTFSEKSPSVIYVPSNTASSCDKTEKLNERSSLYMNTKSSLVESVSSAVNENRTKDFEKYTNEYESKSDVDDLLLTNGTVDLINSGKDNGRLQAPALLKSPDEDGSKDEKENCDEKTSALSYGSRVDKFERRKLKDYRSMSLRQRKKNLVCKEKSQIGCKNTKIKVAFEANFENNECTTSKEEKSHVMCNDLNRCLLSENVPFQEPTEVSDLNDSSGLKGSNRIRDVSDHFIEKECCKLQPSDTFMKEFEVLTNVEDQYGSAENTNDNLVNNFCFPTSRETIILGEGNADKDVCDFKRAVNDSLENKALSENMEWEENSLIESINLEDLNVENSCVKGGNDKSSGQNKDESQDLFDSPLFSNLNRDDDRGNDTSEEGVGENICRFVPVTAEEGINYFDDRKKVDVDIREHARGGEPLDDSNVKIKRRVKGYKCWNLRGSCSEESAGESHGKGSSETNFTLQHYPELKMKEICVSKDIEYEKDSENLPCKESGICPSLKSRDSACKIVEENESEELPETQLYHEVFGKARLDVMQTSMEDMVLKSHKESLIGQRGKDDIVVKDTLLACQENGSFDSAALQSTPLMVRCNAIRSPSSAKQKNFSRFKNSIRKGQDGIESLQCAKSLQYSTKNSSRCKQYEYFVLNPVKSYGMTLTASLSNISSEHNAMILMLVHEFGFSLWSTVKEKRTLSESELPIPKDDSDSACIGEWRVISQKQYHICPVADIRSVCIIGLTFYEEARCLLGVNRVNSSLLDVTYAHYDTQNNWVIARTIIDISGSICDGDIFGFAQSEWCATFCWNTKNTSLSFCVIDFDVIYSKRKKQWGLLCNPFFHSHDWYRPLRSFVALFDEGSKHLALCSTGDELHIYNVVENKVISRIHWNLAPVVWAASIKDLLFVLSYDCNLQKTYLAAINPVSGISDVFHSWYLESSFRSDGNGREIELCDCRLQSDKLVAVYNNGLVAHVLLSS